MRVVHVASEVTPFAQSGGLADVLGGLPPALAQAGVEVGVMLPLYRGVEAKITAAGATLDSGTPISITVGPHVFAGSLRTARLRNVTFGFVDCAPLYDRPGGIYGPTAVSDWTDNHLRFAVLGKAALEHGAKLVGGVFPDVLHVHDWQASPAAVYARIARAPCAIVATIHNLAFRGIFHKSVMTEVGFPWAKFNHRDLEFHDQVSFLKGAMAAADVVTAVSPSYAHEILTPAFGEALDGFLRNDIKRIVGIVNGIDVDRWDPETDAALPAPFSAASLENKALCRSALAAELRLDLEPQQPLIAVISRMTAQKGLDLVGDIVPLLHRLDAKLVVLGSGEPEYEARFRWLAEVFGAQVAVAIGFDINLSRRIYAGSDLFLMPSRFEPCGLGQLYAMRYGAIPIVNSVGGLRDTVVDVGSGRGLKKNAKAGASIGTGFAFAPASAPALLGALERAVGCFRDQDIFTAIRRSAMARDSSWTVSAEQYLDLYRSLRT